ncbi:MAG: BON domain-containing protein [Planctomycetaceae bacterium]|nr:BON domain-containing protein [Planctomycetaceae bacterium]
MFHVISPVHAQWWGSESLPGNPSFSTYKTRFGYWQYGALERNISTPQRFANQGIIRNWNDGSIIAVDRNAPGNRFAQQGTPNLTYIPQVNYFDKDLLTDINYQSGLRQYWPEDQRLLNHEWEQITYEPQRSPANAVPAVTSPVAAGTSPTPAAAPRQEQRNRVQTVVIQQIPATTAQSAKPKLTYHQRIMQGHAERRAAEEERNRQYAQQLADQLAGQNRQREEWVRRSQQPGYPGSVEPLWFREQVVPVQLLPMVARESQPGYEMPGMTSTMPVNPVAEQEKRLEYALAGSPEISFYSPFQTKIENGTVTVTGVVGSEEQRQAAERILLAQPGVQRVQNDLTVAE